MVNIQPGEIFDIPADIRVNTVNCIGVMGAGVALAFKNRYPAMFKDYQKACKAGTVKPGRLHVWKNLESEWIINFPTKIDWREPSKYEYIEAGLKSLREFLAQHKGEKVVMPPLGCGLGGLDWGKVSSMIRESLSDLESEVIVLEPNILRNASKSERDLDPTIINQLTAGGIRCIDSSMPGLGENVAAIGESRMFIKGASTLVRSNLLVIIPSLKPAEKEKRVAEAFVEELARPGLVIGAGYAPSVERVVIRRALEHGAGVVVFIAEGILNFRVREDLKDIWSDDRSAVVSIAHPQQRWNRQLAYRTRLLEFGLAHAVLITDPTPRWVTRFLEKLSEERLPQIFHPKYDGSTPRIRELDENHTSQAIGRNPQSGKPNIDAILKAMELGANNLGIHQGINQPRLHI